MNNAKLKLLKRFTVPNHDVNSNILDVNGQIGACGRNALAVLHVPSSMVVEELTDLHAELKKLAKEANRDYRLDENIQAFLDGKLDLKWQPLPKLDLTACKVCDDCLPSGHIHSVTETCEECHGDGNVELHSSHNEYDVLCKTCRGHGEVYSGPLIPCPECDGTKRDWMHIPSMKVTDKYCLNSKHISLFEPFTNVEIAWHNEFEYFFVQFNEGYGVCMPMHV